jgi:hypothetical protein
MTYHVTIKSPVERETKIQAGRDASTREEDFYEFRNQKTKLKVIRIDIGPPLYRMENFRTFIDQKEYIVRENKPDNFFVGGQENESAQQVQHEILVNLAKQGRADSIVPVIDILPKEKQREPLLIAHRGVVVNGNRRLAAMRELLVDDPAAFNEFTHVDCLVLPDDLMPDEIVDIEAGLQAKPETKLDYDWIGDCQLISKLLSMGKTIPQIADRLNRKQNEIKNSLQAVTEANTYLKDWARAPGEYSRVRDAEQFFKDLPSQLQGKDPQLEDGSRVIAWNLYDHREELGERLYAFNVTFGRRASDVLDRLATELGVPLTRKADEGAADFEVALDEDDGSLSYEPVVDILRDPDRHEDAVDTLVDVCRGIIESEKGRKSGSAALKAVSTAHAKLTEVDLTRAGPETYASLNKQLEAVIKKATELRTKLDSYLAGKRGNSSEVA